MRRDILDCTLRDGGYVNNWRFDIETSLSIINGLYESGIRWIEIGIMGKNPDVGKQTKFSDFSQIKPFLVDRKKDCHYAVMVTTASSDIFEYPFRSDETPDVIRVAFFKNEIERTISLAKDLIKKGYLVFLQAMATFMYTKDELINLCSIINETKPYAFYMVDSFSTMFPNDVVEMRDTILSSLDKKIMFGFHAHNNIQMAFSNVQQFMEDSVERDLLIDSSIYGMGRGAGNVPTELLMMYLNKRYTCSFKTSIILNLFDNHLKQIYSELPWGYTLPYYLTAVNHINSAWAWYFLNQGIVSSVDLENALKMVPNEWTYTMVPAIAEEIVKKIKG